MTLPIVLDFETLPIGPRPEHYPPHPVGVGLWVPGRGPRYYAWGHPTGNNCRELYAKSLVRDVWRSGRRILAQNFAFDAAVARAWATLAWLPVQRVEDTKILAFLADPERRSLGLENLVRDVLGKDPEGYDELRAWVIEHVRTPEGKRPTKRTWGAYIAQAPGDLVGRYTVAQLRWTRELWQHYAWVRDAMPEAYERERRYLEVVEHASELGMPIDRRSVARFVEQGPKDRARLERWIRRRLKAPGLELEGPGSDDALADALGRARKIRKWERTFKTQKRRTAHDALVRTCRDAKLVEVLHARSILKTLHDMASTWLELSQTTGNVHPTWNTTIAWHEIKQRKAGARTGRSSSEPNVQNILKRPRAFNLPGGIEIPNPRAWVRAGRGEYLVDADYSQQEFRILAHFEQGALCKAYNEDSKLDVHGTVQRMALEQTGEDYGRDPLKTTGFGILFGRGAAAVASELGLTWEEGQALRRAYYRALPGINTVRKALNKSKREKQPFLTWGGRQYHCEPPEVEEIHFADGSIEEHVVRTFEYKMLNTLIQGSAADHLKQAAIDADDVGIPLILFVHDELIALTDENPRLEAARLVEVMEKVGPFNVPMRADAGWGKTWQQAKK